MSFNVNGVDIKNPSEFKIELFNITNMQRLANGSMTGNLIAKKRKFYFTYAVITGEEWDAILDAIWNTNRLFFTLKYPYNGTTKYAQVYVGSIPADLHRVGTGKDWVWKNLTFNLIEQ